jgi:membrane fusion protein, multidrug efflux system
MTTPRLCARNPWRTAAGALLLAVCLVPGACSDESSSASTESRSAERPVPVTVAAVEPYATVAVKARVDGQIVRVGFSEGQDVTAGQLLFQIDPRPFQVQVKQADANLLRDRAHLDYARSDKKRQEDLIKGSYVSREAYAQAVSNLEAAQATVSADEAALESARLELEFCTIRSPISGRTGKILIQEGNLVKANDTNPLVVINQISPIYVSFSVPERRLGEITRRMASGAPSVDAIIGDSAAAPHAGKLSFIDNAVDATTGTIRLKATFANDQRLLWPGQFVTAVLTLGEQSDAILVPTQAVQNGPNGAYVFVVAADGTVAVRAVSVGEDAGLDTIIESGLVAGERVVVSGQLRLKPGSKVSILADAGTK